MAPIRPHHEADKTEIDTISEAGLITFKPRALNIVWGADPRYWQLPKPGDIEGTADLLQVSWLDVTGTTDALEVGKYEVGFEVTIKPDAFGWNSCQAFLTAKVGRNGKLNWKKVSLKQGSRFLIPPPDDVFHVDVKQENEDKQIHFGLYEVWSGKWKGGLSIHEAFVKKVA